MTVLVPIALFGWPIIVLFLFVMLPAVRASILGVLGAVLFLPDYAYKFDQLPSYGKMEAGIYAVLVGLLFFAPKRYLRFRPCWLDIPIVILCVCPFASSITNGLGIYDGISAVRGEAISWGFPYLIGRLCFSDWRSMRELFLALFIGGLVYVPLCLFEVRMSPQLKPIFYGFGGADPDALRMFGWRPSVFMGGLMLTFFMASVTLIGLYFWQTRFLTRIAHIPVGWMAIGLLVLMPLWGGTGATILCFIGVVVLLSIRVRASRWIILALMMFPVLFIAGRAIGAWDMSKLVSVIAPMASGRRAESAETRRYWDTRLAEKARQRPLFGWGGWGRNRIAEEETGKDISLTDSKWVIQFGQTGMVGLAAWMMTLLLPVVLIIFRLPPSTWVHPSAVPAVLASVILCLWMIDCTQNWMYNPIYVLMIGGLAGWQYPSTLMQPFRPHSGGNTIPKPSNTSPSWPLSRRKTNR